MTRILVSGARGFFGSLVVDLLRSAGQQPLAASRRPGARVRLDLEDRASVRAALQPGDVLVDATGPFQRRTITSIEEAIAIGAHIVDLCDSLDYARRAAGFDAAARAGGVSVFNCCSSVSVLSAFAVRLSGIAVPERVHGFLAPATRHTANRGAADAFLASLGRPIDVWRGGGWRSITGWSEARAFASVGRRGRLVEMADAFTLPRAFPTLRDVDFFVNPNTRGAGLMLALAQTVPLMRPLISAGVRYGGWAAKMLGSNDGVLAYEIEGRNHGPVASTVVFRGRESFLMAAIPAALAAQGLADGSFTRRGVVPVTEQVADRPLLEALRRHGIEVLAGVDPRG